MDRRVGPMLGEVATGVRGYGGSRLGGTSTNGYKLYNSAPFIPLDE